MERIVPKLRFPEYIGEWNKAKIIDFAPLQRGFDLPVNNIILGEYPVVFSNGALKTHNEFKVKAPGVVTGRSGTIGKIHFIEKDYWPHNTSLWVTNFNANDPKFVYYFYNVFDLEKFSTGSGVPTLNRNDIHCQNIRIPTPHEQTKIANFLTSVDDKICQLKKEKELLEQYKKGVMQKIFSQEIRFKDENGKDYPEWEEKKLGGLGKIQKGKQLNKSELIEIGIYPALNGGILPSGFTDDWNVEANTITISEGGNSCGYINFMTSRFWSGGHCYTLQEPTINNVYLYQYLKYREQDVMSLRVGSGLPNIQKKDITTFEISYPESIKEQYMIADFLSAIDNKINQCTTQIEKMEIWKKGLLQQMFV